MSLQKTLSVFPKGSEFRALVRDLASRDPKRRENAHERVRQFDRFQTWEEARTPSWAISEAEALAILHAAQTVAFPLPEHEWEDGFSDLLTSLWRSPYASLTGSVGRVYPTLRDARRRCALLTLLGVISTREAAQMFMTCVRNYGWPDGVHDRLIEEMEKLMAFGDVMLPDVVLTAGQLAKYVGEAVLGALARGSLKMEEVGDRIEALAPHTLTSLERVLKSAAKHQNKPGIAWRFAERYASVRHQTCILLDLAGHLREPRLSAALHEAARFKDPRIVTYAALGLLRRGEVVGKQILNTAARSHETRDALFDGLSAMRLQHRFPQRWRTWEAFAAANMVEWLLYPAELGREPDDLRLEHVEWLDRRGKTAVFVWKFRVKGDPWMSGVSGPHTLRGKPKPVDGPLTFSRFDAWKTATPREHLENCAGTLEEWRSQLVRR
jgi:hypothetical protein